MKSIVTALLLALAGTAFAQSAWPEKPITMIVPFPPGGVADTVARPVAEALSKELKQPVVIENKAGAGGGLGIALASRAPGAASRRREPTRSKRRSWTGSAHARSARSSSNVARRTSSRSVRSELRA